MYTPKGKKNSKPLFEVEGDRSINTPPPPVEYDILLNNKKVYNLRSTLYPSSFLPAPTIQQRSRGFISRYFLQHKYTGEVLEVDQPTYESIDNQQAIYHYPSYDVGSTRWRLQGPVADQEINGYIVEGAQTANEYYISQLQKVLPNIRTYLTDPTQFVE